MDNITVNITTTPVLVDVTVVEQPNQITLNLSPLGLPGAAGIPGKSAYQIWLDEGNTGTEAEFLASLQGEDAVGGGGGSPSNVVIFNQVLQVASTTLTDVPGLTFTIPASKIALVRLHLVFWGGSVQKVRLKFNVTSGTLKRGFNAGASYSPNYVVIEDYLNYVLEPAGTNFFFPGRSANLEISMEANAAPTTIQVQVAQNTAGSFAADVRFALLEYFI